MFFWASPMVAQLKFFALSPDLIPPWQSSQNAQNLFYKVKFTDRNLEEKYLRIVTVFNGFKRFNYINLANKKINSQKKQK
jgi:hypothetical protein